MPHDQRATLAGAILSDRHRQADPHQEATSGTQAKAMRPKGDACHMPRPTIHACGTHALLELVEPVELAKNGQLGVGRALTTVGLIGPNGGIDAMLRRLV